MRPKRMSLRVAGAAALLVPLLARAYGPEGHLIAGIAAERSLCAAAREQVAVLGGGDRLGELGLWADRIRSDEEYAASLPWHYLNIRDGGSLRTFRHPPEGDVLEAIGRFKRVLADRSRPPDERAEALRFLVHVVVDIHQPLHIGRAADRGGNTIELKSAGEMTNLHRFWDSGAVTLAGLSIGRYARSLRTAMQDMQTGAKLDPVVWAEESLALRATVYDFDVRAGLDAAYIERSITITRERLALAALRLAGTLNEMFCP
jgi:S1/P1 Nuclease